MGVPKFYRWISERYPCLSEVVKEYQVPEFDNLYLDMNGIIHNCSHPNDDDPHFRITEEQIFKDIFHYIEVLFRIVSPKKTFFMAVDGVAPRAKMNQQRGRRFRSAKEAEENIKRALEKGETLPTEKRFDSNCITPGTAFMERLQTQLEYFVKSKITYDRTWQGINIYLSGHQVPGEGEHKIMSFIRHERSQAEYDPNTRHCLYGLDADLLVLGLCSHEPHFALLREEVKFTKKSKDSKTVKVEETTFHLLHISLLREYIDHEFEALKQTLPFPYNIESIIDDWVLMGFLVGNDFIPHLPDLHIATNALPFLYETYIKTLPELGGYINENGMINLKRFQGYLKAISKFDIEHFEEAYDDYKWLQLKSRSKRPVKTDQPDVARHDIRLKPQSEEQSIQIVKDLAIKQGVMSLSDDEESLDPDEEQAEGDALFYQEFKHHKKGYYEEKFKVTASKAQIGCIAYEYILGIQWICHYYYNGVQSWSWYYPYHYAPYMSDLLKASEMKLKYKMNKPFLPYQQLLAVLPEASKDHIPEAYWNLMNEDNSTIGDFYPKNFLTDLNGKQQEWEAVVLIPFIDEKRLLDAMEPLNRKLTMTERSRNKHGPCYLYTYDANVVHLVKSTIPEDFPEIERCTARMKTIPLQSWVKINYQEYVKGLLPGCQLSVYYQGFPTLYHIAHTAYLKKQSVKVFQHPSRGENMILQILPKDGKTTDENTEDLANSNESLEEIGQRLLGKSVYVNWPHMEEAKVVAVSDGEVEYVLHEEVTGNRGSKHKLARKELSNAEADMFYGQVHDISEKYLNRHGIDVGDTNTILYAQLLLGRKYVCSKTGEITLEKQWSTSVQPFALEAAVKDISVKGPTLQPIKSIQELFPKGAEVFNMGNPHYGSLGKVVDTKDSCTVVNFKVIDESFLEQVTRKGGAFSYVPGWKIASLVGISAYMVSRMTGSIYIYFPSSKKWNVGLNLKFTREGCGIAGYTKRQKDMWLYSTSLCDILKDYLQSFPEIFDYLEVNLSKKSEEQLNAEDVFGSNNVSEKLKQLSSWLKSLPCANGRKVHGSSSILEPGVVKALDDQLTSFKLQSSNKAKEVFISAMPRDLYRPLAEQGTLIPDKNADHRLRDRVVNSRAGYTVPLGYRGTIIGIHTKGDTELEVLFDVMFDEVFLGGLTLGGLCPDRRGYQMPACALINLSYGERLVKRAKKPVAVVRPNNQQFVPSVASNISSRQLDHSPHSAFSPTKKFVSSNSRYDNSAGDSTTLNRDHHSASLRSKTLSSRNASTANSLQQSERNSPKPRLVPSGKPSQSALCYQPNQSRKLTLGETRKHLNSPSSSSIVLTEAARSLPIVAANNQNQKPSSQTAVNDIKGHKVQNKANTPLKSSHNQVHTVRVDKTPPRFRLKKLAKYERKEEVDGKSDSTTELEEKTRLDLMAKQEIEQNDQDYEQSDSEALTSVKLENSLQFTKNSPDLKTSAAIKNAELSRLLKNVLKLESTEETNLPEPSQTTSVAPEVESASTSSGDLNKLLASLQTNSSLAGRAMHHSTNPVSHPFQPGARFHHPLPPYPYLPMQVPIPYQTFSPRNHRGSLPMHPYIRYPGDPNQPYYARPPPTILLRPENFRPPLSKGSTNLSGSYAATSRKEGADKLLEILNLENEENKLKDESECNETWSKDSIGDVTTNDRENEGDSNPKQKSNPEEQNHDEKKGENTKTDDNRGTSPSTEATSDIGEKSHVSSSEELMRWCQINNFLPPVYSYSDSEQDKDTFICTVQLPNGLTCRSTAQPTRNDAMEIAASLALSSLKPQGPLILPPSGTAYGIPTGFGSPYYVKDMTAPLYQYSADGRSLYPIPYVLPPKVSHATTLPHGRNIPPPPVSSQQQYLPVGTAPLYSTLPMGPEGLLMYPGYIPARPHLLAYPPYPPPRVYTPPFPLRQLSPPQRKPDFLNPTIGSQAIISLDDVVQKSTKLLVNSNPFIPSQAICKRSTAGALSSSPTTTNSNADKYTLSDHPASKSNPATPTLDSKSHKGAKKSQKPKAKLAISFAGSLN